MQQKNLKAEILARVFGLVVRKYREKCACASINKFAFENDLDKGNLSRIENGIVDTKLSSIWKIAQALNVKPSKLLDEVQENLPDNFNLIEF